MFPAIGLKVETGLRKPPRRGSQAVSGVKWRVQLMSVVAEPLLEQQLGEGVAESQVGQFFQINTRPQWPQRRQPFKWSGQCELAVKSVARSGSCSQTGRTPLAGLRELSSSVRGERCVEREVGAASYQEHPQLPESRSLCRPLLLLLLPAVTQLWWQPSDVTLYCNCEIDNLDSYFGLHP